MSSDPLQITLAAATVLTGLVAGLLFGYACSVMPGLRRCDDRVFVQTMQRVNVAIVNGWFLLCFLGAPVLTVTALVLAVSTGDPATGWITAGMLLYTVTIGVTAGVNIPLNNQLARADSSGRDSSLRAARDAFEPRWNRWHNVRTVTCVAAFACLARALLLA